MSSADQVVASALAQLALACDGAFLGVTLAIFALETIFRYRRSSSALAKIRRAPSSTLSGLRSILSCSSDDGKSRDADQKLVIVRGYVQPKPAVGGHQLVFWDKVLVSRETSEKAVVVQRTQRCLYNEWRGLLGCTFELRNLLSRPGKTHEITSLRTVPFVLSGNEHGTSSDYVVVNLDGSKHHLPLTTVYHQMHPIHDSHFTFMQVMFGRGLPVGLLDEEKILPLGKEITAVGICSSQDGVLEIKSSKELPYFLCEMTENQMEGDLAVRSKVLLWSGIILSTLSFGIMGYSIVRNWTKWKERRHRRRQIQLQQDAVPEIVEDDDSRNVPEGELCVICLMRRRRSAFVPCGHLVCCSRCALAVERDSSPKCPVCRQDIRTSIRIYAS